MNTEEFRAMVAQGPMVVMADRASLLRLMDEREDAIAETTALRRELKITGILAVVLLAAWMWYGAVLLFRFLELI